MDPNNPPAPPLVALCPRCFCPINLRRTFPVDVCLPFQPPIQQGPPTSLPPAGQHPNTDPPVYSSQPPAPQPDNAPAPPQQDNAPAPSPEQSGQLPSQERELDRAIHGKNRRSSASSSLSFDSAFTQFSYNADFIDELKLLATSPAILAASPSVLATYPSILATYPSILAFYQVFTDAHGCPNFLTLNRVLVDSISPGAGATSQTNGFPHAFMLAFDDPATADAAYEQFRASGEVPTHGHGPWVVFIGRKPGVFTAYEELCASVVGFSNNCYRCCESVKEGTQALSAFMGKQAMITPTTQTIPGLMQTGQCSDAADAVDDSWWCCVAGADPGVYKGLARLAQAAPAPGGVRRVKSEEEGWELWTTFFTNDEIRIVPHA